MPPTQEWMLNVIRGKTDCGSVGDRGTIVWRQSGLPPQAESVSDGLLGAVCSLSRPLILEGRPVNVLRDPAAKFERARTPGACSFESRICARAKTSLRCSSYEAGGSQRSSSGGSSPPSGISATTGTPSTTPLAGGGRRAADRELSSQTISRGKQLGPTGERHNQDQGQRTDTRSCPIVGTGSDGSRLRSSS